MRRHHQGRPRRRRRLRHQAPRRHPQHRRRRGRLAGQPRTRQDPRSGRQVRHRPCHHRSRRQPGAARGRRGHPVHADADARRAGDRLPEGRQARAGRDPAAPIRWQDAEQRRPRRSSRPAWWRCAATPGASTRATSACTSAIAAGEFAIQQMDVQTYFFRRTQHERARPAAQLDRPPAVAPRRAHGRPVRLPVRQPDRHRPTPCRGRSIRRSASRWTCRSS